MGALNKKEYRDDYDFEVEYIGDYPLDLVRFSYKYFDFSSMSFTITDWPI